MTAFFTHCWKNTRLELAVALLCVLLAAAWPLPLRAETTSAEVSLLRLERAPDGIFLYANVKVEATRVFPSPVFISAMRPRWRIMPPINCTSK